MLVALRGGGDLGSGVALRLHQAGFKVLITEIPQPLAVRRLVSYSEAVYDGQMEVEGITARLINPTTADIRKSIEAVHREGAIPLIIDPDFEFFSAIKPPVLVDCRMRKSPPRRGFLGEVLTIGLGPGFIPGTNCNAAVETKRGHNLGRVYWTGRVEDDTGEPDAVLGISWERLLKAPVGGIITAEEEIGTMITQGEVIAYVDDQPVVAKIDGVLRGLLRSNLKVTEGLKIGDLDPRAVPEYCWTVSDKARAIGGGVLEAILSWRVQKSVPFE